MSKIVKKLVDFLTNSFSASEMEELAVELGDDELAHALPSKDVPTSDYAREFVSRLKQRGLIKPQFFTKLEERRPNKKRQIARIRKLWNARLSEKLVGDVRSTARDLTDRALEQIARWMNLL